MKAKEQFNNKLLVEGNDDQHVIWSLCKKYQVAETFDVIDCGGIDTLIPQIGVRFKQAGLKTLGIIVDADTDLQQRWVSIGNILKANGFVIPNEFPVEGYISMNETGHKVGLWMMPNNNLNGMLEDFIAFLVPADDRLMPVVNATLQNLEDDGINMYNPIHRSKAAIHTWLSWQEAPGTPMGLSITKKYLNTDTDTCQSLINWLNALFA